jgi:hypothetical protein
MLLFKLRRFVVVASIFLLTTNAHAQKRKDIRSPLIGGPVLMKDLSRETKLPSLELEQVLSALAQNPVFKLKLLVTKGTPIAAEVEKQVQAKGLVDRVQMVEQ